MILVITGVSGSGKTTVGAMLAGRRALAGGSGGVVPPGKHWPFADADMFHPADSVAKMQAGVPLTDEDRWPWLDAIAAWIDERIAAGESAVVTCSALRRAYRDFLREGRADVRMIFLQADREVVARRLTGRPGHFFPARLLDSQIRDLEPPEPGEEVLVVRADGSPEDTVTEIIRGLRAG